jgi:hypothetical protein
MAGEKKYTEAEPLLVEGHQGMKARRERIVAPDLYDFELAHGWLIRSTRLGASWREPQWRSK